MPVASSGFLRRAASMSSYYNRRGSPRPHRGYSSRPSPRPAYAGAEFVSGDSHLSAVHAANDSLRRGGGAAGVPPPQYRHGPQFQPPPYGYGQPQQSVPSHGFVPYNYSHPQPLPPGSQYGYGSPNSRIRVQTSADEVTRISPVVSPFPSAGQYGHWHPQPYRGGPPNVGFPPPNAGFRPGAPHQPPRLAEYHRRWRFAQKQPPRQAERFKVLSYNILADYLAQEHHDLYENIPSFILDWNWRKSKIVFEIGLWYPDILCLQEVDKFTDFEQEMATRGFSGIWKMRTGNAADGCAIFWRTTRFQLRYEEDIEFNKLGLRDNVAQLCVLESVVPRNGQIESIHLPTSPNNPQQARQVVVCNIHVLYNPKRGDIKLGQVRTLLDRAYTISKMWNDAPVILCGDFNSTPKSPLYNFISEQKLNLSGLARNTISGQQSSPQGLYTGPNTSRYRFRPPFPTTNGRDGSTFPLDSRSPQSEARNLVRDKQGLLSCLEGPPKDACNSDAEAQGMATEGEAGMAVDNSCEGGFAGIKVEPREKPNIVEFLHSPTTLDDEILQLDSSETVDSTHTIKINESFGLKDSVEELRGVSSKDSSAQGSLSGDVTRDFEGNIVQSDTLLNVSEDDPCDKEKDNESMSGQNNCTTSESESSCVNVSLKLADALRNMSNTGLAEESNTEPTQIASPVEPVHQPNCAVSDSYGNQCTPDMVNKHSDLYSCQDEFGNHVRAFEDDAPVNDNLCSDVNPDPSFFKEFSGNNESLHSDEDQLPTVSNGLSHGQKVVNSYGMYYNDPFRWTADELKAATGNEQCTHVAHNLKVRSVYTDVEDFEGTKDANKEPLVTSYHRKFMGTVDYIWASEDLQTVDVLDTFPKEILKQTTGFPTKKWGSDHIALVCELAFTK